MIELNNITCGYDKKTPVLKDISLLIPANKITFILGANGRGKTTLIKCRTNQMKLYGGQISIDGKNLSSMTTKEISRLMSYVPQSIEYGIEYNVLDFIAFGRTPYLNAFQSPTREAYDIAMNVAEQSNISYLCNKQINTISGGERQLVYIARALAQETPFIIMDEPMSALDFSNQAMILKVISSLAKDNKTVILSSHNPNHALAVESEVCLIDKNKSIIQGSSNEILSNQENIINTFGERVIYQDSESGGYISFSI